MPGSIGVLGCVDSKEPNVLEAHMKSKTQSSIGTITGNDLTRVFSQADPANSFEVMNTFLSRSSMPLPICLLSSVISWDRSIVLNPGFPTVESHLSLTAPPICVNRYPGIHPFQVEYRAFNRDNVDVPADDILREVCEGRPSRHDRHSSLSGYRGRLKLNSARR